MRQVGVALHEVCTLSFMMAMYAFKRPGRLFFILLFAVGCLFVERLRLSLRGLALRCRRGGLVRGSPSSSAQSRRQLHDALGLG